MFTCGHRKSPELPTLVKFRVCRSWAAGPIKAFGDAWLLRADVVKVRLLGDLGSIIGKCFIINRSSEVGVWVESSPSSFRTAIRPEYARLSHIVKHSGEVSLRSEALPSFQYLQIWVMSSSDRSELRILPESFRPGTISQGLIIAQHIC